MDEDGPKIFNVSVLPNAGAFDEIFETEEMILHKLGIDYGGAVMFRYHLR